MNFSILKNTIEDIYLFYINIKNLFYNFFLYLVEISLFYSNSLLRKVDLDLMKSYAIKDQFSVSIEESKIIFPNIREELTYGEAIWSSLKKVFDYIKPEKEMIFYDLGSGIGRVCFFTAIKYELNSKGIELLPTFIKNANKIKDKYKINNLEFIEKNWLDIDISDADIIYIAATCLSDETIELLDNKFKTLKEDSIIVSVSVDFKNNDIETLKHFYLPFSWGMADVYVSKILKRTSFN